MLLDKHIYGCRAWQMRAGMDEVTVNSPLSHMLSSPVQQIKQGYAL